MVSELTSILIKDFTGGLVTNVPESELELNQSSDLDNINLLARGFSKRNGDNEFNSTAMDSGNAVHGIGYYQTVAGTGYLMAIAGTKIYKSDALDGTMDDITDVVTITTGKDNLWQHVPFGDLSIFVGGAPDAPIKWPGTGNAAALGGSPPSGTFGFQMRNRVFIGGTTANPSRIGWCVLKDPEDWSGAGSGTSDVAENDSDKLVAGIPLNNNIALLFKNYSIHHLVVTSAPFPVKPLAQTQSSGAVGKNAVVNVNGVVYFITPDARMKATDGYTIADFPDTIDDIWDGLNQNRLKYIQGIHYPKLEQIHWYASNGTSTTNNLAIVWDLRRKCWLRHTTGYKVNVATLAQGKRLFGGHYTGKAYEKDYTTSETFNDASETAPGKINAYLSTGWISLDNLLLSKQIKYFDITAVTKDLGVIKYSYGYDYSFTKSGQISQESSGGKWDVDEWDVGFVWGGEVNIQKRIFSFGRGNVFSIKIFNDEESQTMTINNLNIAMKQSGVKELT